MSIGYEYKLQNKLGKFYKKLAEILFGITLNL